MLELRKFIMFSEGKMGLGNHHDGESDVKFIDPEIIKNLLENEDETVKHEVLAFAYYLRALREDETPSL